MVKAITGNFCIGTTELESLLHLKSVGSPVGSLSTIIENADLTIAGGEDISVQLNYTAAGAKDWMINSRYAGGQLEFSNTTDEVTPLTLKSNGNVGIGTVSPAGKLQVSGGNAIFDGNVGVSQVPILQYRH